MLLRRHLRGCDEVPCGVERRHHLTAFIHGDKAKPHAIEKTASDHDRLEAGAGNGVRDLYLMASRVPSHRQHLPLSLQLLGESQLVAIALRSQRNALLANPAFLALKAAAAHASGTLQPAINRRELLPRQHQLLGHRIGRPQITLPLQQHGIAEPEYIEQTLHQPEVLHIFPGDEVEDQIAVGAAVMPGLVGFQAGSRVARAAGRLSVTDVNDPPVIEIAAARLVALYDVVVAVFGDELKIFPRVKQPSIMLPQPLTLAPQRHLITLSPELFEIRGAMGSSLLIKLLQDAVRGNRGQIGAVSSDRDGIIAGGTLEVGRLSLVAAKQKQRPG